MRLALPLIQSAIHLPVEHRAAPVVLHDLPDIEHCHVHGFAPLHDQYMMPPRDGKERTLQLGNKLFPNHIFLTIIQIQLSYALHIPIRKTFHFRKLFRQIAAELFQKAVAPCLPAKHIIRQTSGRLQSWQIVCRNKPLIHIKFAPPRSDGAGLSRVPTGRLRCVMRFVQAAAYALRSCSFLVIFCSGLADASALIRRLR